MYGSWTEIAVQPFFFSFSFKNVCFISEYISWVRSNFDPFLLIFSAESADPFSWTLSELIQGVSWQNPVFLTADSLGAGVKMALWAHSGILTFLCRSWSPLKSKYSFCFRNNFFRASKNNDFSFLPIDAKVGAGGFISNSSAVWSAAQGLQAVTAGSIGFRAPDGGKLDVCVTGPGTEFNE